jgi:hypothetical protein
MSKTSNLKAMLKKDLIDENIRLQKEITKIKEYHFIYQQSVNIRLSAKGSEMASDRVKVISENANLRTEIQKLTTECSQKTATELSMINDLKRTKTTGNKLASIISDQFPRTTRNSLFSVISQRELAPFGVFSGLTSAQTLNEEIRSGLTVVHYTRTQPDENYFHDSLFSENIQQLHVLNENFPNPDKIAHFDDVVEEPEIFETENSRKPSQLLARKRAKTTGKVPVQIAVAKKSTHSTGKVVKAYREKLVERRNDRMKSPIKYKCTKWTGLVLKKSKEDTQ